MDIMPDEMPNMDWTADWGADWSSFPFEMSWMIMAMIFGGIILLIVYIAIARYIHNDAVKREIPNPGVWIFIFLIFNIMGLVVYFLVRGSYDNKKTIKQAQPQQTQVYTYYTPVKNTNVAEVSAPASAAKFCPMCGKKLDRLGTQFCPQCGNKI